MKVMMDIIDKCGVPRDAMLCVVIFTVPFRVCNSLLCSDISTYNLRVNSTLCLHREHWVISTT